MATPTKGLVAGDRAPAFSLPDGAGVTHSAASLAGAPYVLYFYPKDDTAVCTTEACEFRDALPDFSKLGVRVLGVSPDDARSHERFARKHALNFTLLSDVPDEAGVPRVCEAFGVWVEKSMYGKSYMGVERSTFLVDAKGVIARVWNKVRVQGHVPEVLGAVRALTTTGHLPVGEGAAVNGVAPRAGKAGSANTTSSKAGAKAKSAKATSATGKAGAKKPAAKKVPARRSAAR